MRCKYLCEERKEKRRDDISYYFFSIDEGTDDGRPVSHLISSLLDVFRSYAYRCWLSVYMARIGIFRIVVYRLCRRYFIDFPPVYIQQTQRVLYYWLVGSLFLFPTCFCFLCYSFIVVFFWCFGVGQELTEKRWQVFFFFSILVFGAVAGLVVRCAETCSRPTEGTTWCCSLVEEGIMRFRS